MPVEGRGLGSRAAHDGGRDVGTGENLTASERVQRLQTVLHAKAKEAPGLRFYSLSDKVWRDDVIAVAWQAVRRNGGGAGVDGETVADVESFGVEGWLGALARDLQEGTYRPRAVRQVLIPKKQRGKFRPLGIPCLRDRVAQTAAMLVLSPIFEADLQPEQYAYRPGRHAHDAVKRVQPAAEDGPPGGGGRRPDGLLRPDSPRGVDAVHRPARERRAAAGLGQGVAGDGGGGGRRARWSPPHESGASRAEGDPARVTDFAVVQQRLPAPLHSGLEGAGLRPALRGGNRQLRGRLRGARQSAGSGHADGGRSPA